MNPVKISLLSIYMLIVFFLLLAAAYDVLRCLMYPDAYYYKVISTHALGSPKWYFDLLMPNLLVIVFCIPKIYIMKMFSKAHENGSIWNPIFYFAFAIVVTAGVLTVVEIFDTPNIEIIPDA